MKHLFAILCLIIFLPGTSLAETVGNPPTAPDRLNDGAEIYFDRKAARLNLIRPIDDPNIEGVMFVFSAFTYGDVGVTVFLERKPELKDHDPIVMLNASWIDSRKNTYKKRGGVDRFSSVTVLYDVSISLADFNAIKKGLSESEFYSEPSETESDVEPGFICLDGAAYFIEARFPDQRHLISRQTCYEDYSVSGKHAALLIKLARKKFPALRDTLHEVEGMVSGE